MFDVQFSIKDIRNKAKKEGIEEGIEKGIEKGREEGKIEGKIETARNLLKKGVSISVISDCTGLDEGFIRKLNLDDLMNN